MVDFADYKECNFSNKPDNDANESPNYENDTSENDEARGARIPDRRRVIVAIEVGTRDFGRLENIYTARTWELGEL